MDATNSSQSHSITVPSRLKLVVTQGPCAGQTFDSATLNCVYMVVGRTKKSKVCIKDASISEKHAEIAWDSRSSAWTLRDIDSSNGTLVNGAALQPYRTHHLKAGDNICFGTKSTVTVELEDMNLSDLTVEVLLRAYLESICQALEGAATEAANDMVRRCHETLDGLLTPDGVNESQSVALAR